MSRRTRWIKVKGRALGYAYWLEKSVQPPSQVFRGRQIMRRGIAFFKRGRLGGNINVVAKLVELNPNFIFPLPHEPRTSISNLLSIRSF